MFSRIQKRPSRALVLTVLVALLPIAVVARWPFQGFDDPGGLWGSGWGRSRRAAPCEPPPGVFSLSTLRLGPGAVIDDVDSPFQTYVEGLTQGTGQAAVGALGSIELLSAPGAGPTVVVGSARAAWADQTKLAKGTYVTGSIEPVALRKEWPELPPHDFGSAGDWSLSTGSHSLAGPSAEFRRLEVARDAELTLVGPLELWLEQWLVRDQARIALDTSAGPVVVRVTDACRLGAETVWISKPEDRTRFALLVGSGTPWIDEAGLAPKSEADLRAEALRDRIKGDGSESKPEIHVPLELLGSGAMYGLIYAPFSGLVLEADQPLTGALTAQSVELRAGAKITTDRRALQAWAAGR
ncbi:MAG: hypothetical protein H6830_12125 [Planctomycetes bacterium]|nr:hypothetical protein [Planctomycetota bacterium]MCB9910827.1 hypothetical protein [Planctomycetota bacterium]MCB9912241.1 hypothetical protein [Planctomycetota bacterium]HPF13836.1 hypothetical protein [Planctomycetota bacterium]